MYKRFLNRVALVCLLTIASAVVSSGEPVQRLDYELLATVEPLGRNAVAPRPAAGEVLLLQFWASWCHSCGALMWEMDELVSSNTGVGYLAVSLDDETGDAREYIRKHALYAKYEDRYFIDSAKQVSRSLGVSAVPSILLVDADGEVLVRKSGHLNSTDLFEFVSAIRSSR